MLDIEKIVLKIRKNIPMNRNEIRIQKRMIILFNQILTILAFFFGFRVKKKPQFITESGLSNLTMKKLTSFFFNFGSFTS